MGIIRPKHLKDASTKDCIYETSQLLQCVMLTIKGILCKLAKSKNSLFNTHGYRIGNHFRDNYEKKKI